MALPVLFHMEHIHLSWWTAYGIIKLTTSSGGDECGEDIYCGRQPHHYQNGY